MGIPDTFPRILCFNFKVLLLIVFIGCFSFDFFEFSPPILEELGRQVYASNFSSTEIAWYVIIGR